jgi:transcriptional regulator with XRE-family HTH domain
MTMNKLGRPKFKIQSERLRHLREDAGFTQQSLADAVYARLGKGTDDQSRLTGYQRIERTGKTSQKFASVVAEVLAKALGKDGNSILSLLTGGTPEAPPDRKDEIESQLRKQLAAGSNAPLKLSLERLSDAENPVQELARQIAVELEIAHLTQRKEELASLAELTGWTQEELLRPASSLGYWLLIVDNVGLRETEICLGLSDVLRRMQVEGEDWLKRWNESDVRITLVKELPWVRVVLEHPRIPQFSHTFSFVRCAPTDSGLKWVKPTWRDDFWIEQLKEWAFRQVNFVSSFKPEDRRPIDLHKLRFVVAPYEFPEMSQAFNFDGTTSAQPILTHKGTLDNLPQETLERVAREGYSHNLAISRLSVGLWEALESILTEAPARCWRIRPIGGGIYFELQMSFNEAIQRGFTHRTGTRYEMYLAEELPSGELRPVPWRGADVSAMAASLQERLRLCQDQVAMGPPAPGFRPNVSS